MHLNMLEKNTQATEIFTQIFTLNLIKKKKNTQPF